MMPSLNYLEVGLRNSQNRVVAALYGPDWLLAPPKQLQLNPDDLRQIEDIKAEIIKNKGRPANHDDVLAQLNFGFWVALFQKKHVSGIWSRGKNALADVFPNMPLAERTRELIYTRLHKVKALRNRIAHHEPIWKQTPPADVVHQDCIDLIRAISVAAADELARIDRFNAAYTTGP